MKAPATAVFCTSTALIVGVASAPQAPRRMAITVVETIVRRLIQIIRTVLTAWVTSAECNNVVVSDDDVPTALSDAETTEYFKVLSASHKCSSAVLPDGTGNTVACHIEVAALT